MGRISAPKTPLFDHCLDLPRQSAFCMVSDGYLVRRSFDFKLCDTARANRAYADFTAKTNGFKQFLKLCFCTGDRRGEQNLHASDQKNTCRTRFKNQRCLTHLWLFLRSCRRNHKNVHKMTSLSPSGSLPETPLEGENGLLSALGAFLGRQGEFQGPPGPLRERPRDPPGLSGSVRKVSRQRHKTQEMARRLRGPILHHF